MEGLRDMAFLHDDSVDCGRNEDILEPGPAMSATPIYKYMASFATYMYIYTLWHNFQCLYWCKPVDSLSYRWWANLTCRFLISWDGCSIGGATPMPLCFVLCCHPFYLAKTPLLSSPAALCCWLHAVTHAWYNLQHKVNMAAPSSWSETKLADILCRSTLCRGMWWVLQAGLEKPCV